MEPPQNITKVKAVSGRENNLNDSALHRVSKGEIKQYKGWKCRYEIITLC
jgi:hypothetical protein